MVGNLLLFVVWLFSYFFHCSFISKEGNIRWGKTVDSTCEREFNNINKVCLLFSC